VIKHLFLVPVVFLFLCSAATAADLRIIVSCNDPLEEKTIRQYAEAKVKTENLATIVESGHGDITIQFKCIPQKGVSSQ